MVSFYRDSQEWCLDWLCILRNKRRGEPAQEAQRPRLTGKQKPSLQKRKRMLGVSGLQLEPWLRACEERSETCALGRHCSEENRLGVGRQVGNLTEGLCKNCLVRNPEVLGQEKSRSFCVERGERAWSVFGCGNKALHRNNSRVSSFKSCVGRVLCMYVGLFVMLFEYSTSLNIPLVFGELCFFF